MTLNFSRRPVFPTNPSEDNLLSTIRLANGCLVEGIPDNGFVKPWPFNWDNDPCDWPFNWDKDPCDCGSDRADSEGSDEPTSNDILDILPSDPFGMDVSATFTALTEWMEDLEPHSENYMRSEAGTENGDCQVYTGFNFYWIDESSNPVGRFDGWEEDKEFGDGSCDGTSVCNVEEIPSSDGAGSFRFNDSHEAAEYCPPREKEESPHEALFFALGFLGVQDLLSVERVCRAFRSVVQNDALLWMNIQIDKPLNERLTDDALMQLVGRAQGNLQSLSLVECSRITDDGLRRVLETNRRLNKLSVPVCTRLSVEGIVNNLKAFKSSGAPGIKHLRIGGHYGVTNSHYEELKLLLGSANCQQPKSHKPRFYHCQHLSLSCDDDRPIDIEMCPRCQNLRLVYDCPAESCQGKQTASQLCRGCKFCIVRCVQCGRCINDGECHENFFMDLLCLSCWKQLPPEMQENRDVPSKSTIFHQDTRYDFHLHG